MRACLLAGLLTAVVCAGPPKPGCVGFEELHLRLENRYEKLRKQEEMAAKPREERMVLLLRAGRTTFENKKLTGEWVLTEILKWKVLQAEKIPAAARLVLDMLPEALETRYGHGHRTASLRAERYRVSKQLVSALMHRQVHIRKAAIECLDALYGTKRGYRADAPDRERKKIQREWRLALRRQSR